MAVKPEKQWPFIVIMGMIFSLTPLAIDMYLPAFPAIANDLSTSIHSVEASVAIFLIAYAIAQLVLGPLSERFDHKKMLLTGMSVFAVASLILPFVQSPLALYAMRSLQALGGGASVVVFAMVQARYNVKQSAQIISYIMAVVVLAPMVAPIIGGELLVAFGWQSIFYVLGAYALLGVLLAWFVLGSKDTEAGKASVSSIPPSSPRKTHGLKAVLKSYQEVFSNGTALAHVLAGSFAFAGLFAFVSGSPFVYIEYFSVSPDNYGYLVGLNALAMIGMNIINARWLKNIHPSSKVICAGLLLGLVSAYLLMTGHLNLSLGFIVAAVVLFTGLLGLMSANAIAGALSHFPSNGGTLAGIYGVAQFGIGGLFSALISLFSATDGAVMVNVMALAGGLSCLCSLYLYFSWYRLTENKTLAENRTLANDSRLAEVLEEQI